MPLIVKKNLPAIKFLKNENIILETSLKTQKNSNYLKLLILNLMPKKIEVEIQLIRLLANANFLISINFLKIDNHESIHTSIKHIDNFYYSFKDIYKNEYDGLIVTGAPLGLIKFEDVRYWNNFKNVVFWSQKNVKSTIFSCWAAQAALHILYQFPKKIRKKKISGIYQHKKISSHFELTRGFDDIFFVPHSRYSDFPSSILKNYKDIQLIADSEQIGAYLFSSKNKKNVFITGHPEYDSYTLLEEYHRDYINGLNPDVPFNYFIKNNTNYSPHNIWRSHGNLLFENWLKYYVY